MVPDRHRVEGGLAIARRRDPAAQPRVGRPRHRRPRRRAGAERQLSRRRRPESTEQRHERHGHGREQHVGLGLGHAIRPPPARACRTRRGLKISGLDLNNTPVHDHERNERHGHERRRRQRGRRLQHDDAQLALHGHRPFRRPRRASCWRDGNNGPDDIHMAESGCAPSLTAADDIGAVQYVQATSAAVSAYTTPAAAMAAGYEPASPTDYPVVVYVNPTIVAANAAAQRTLDPQHVDGLVYATTPSGGDVLAAAMYILPATETKVPMPYGALGAVASPHPGVRTGHALAHHALRHHRATPRAPAARCCSRRRTSPWCGRSRWPAAARHSAAGHPDRGGGGDAAERHLRCIRRDERRPPDSASRLIRRGCVAP